jgi:DNA-binding MarR family transcriptional regulator
VIEWYILRSLFERDGQHASELANTVGRAATSFTPNLDKLQKKGYIERRPDKADRRAVRIYLTASADRCRDEVMNSAHELDEHIKSLFSKDEFESFQKVLARLQRLNSLQDHPSRSLISLRCSTSWASASWNVARTDSVNSTKRTSLMVSCWLT